nr:hypothetical protein Iba_chr14fCG12710 [Ipomoea batatas]
MVVSFRRFPIVFQLWKRCKSGKLFINQKIVSYTNTVSAAKKMDVACSYCRCRRRSPVRCGADVCEMGDLRLGSASCLPLFGDGERRHTEMAAAGDADDKKKLTYLVATAQSSTPHLSSFGFGRALEQ